MLILISNFLKLPHSFSLMLFLFVLFFFLGFILQNSRMDAAIDAMRPLGYYEKSVRETDKEFLKVGFCSLSLSLSSFVKAWTFVGFWLCLRFIRWVDSGLWRRRMAHL